MGMNQIISSQDTDTKTIGLCMIVKNESKVILRSLESARFLVDYILVQDTGSTDGTQVIIRDWLERDGLNGEVYDEPWRDFAYNRSHALARLREKHGIDYALVLDADDHITFEPGFDITKFKAGLSADAYDVELRSGAIRYLRRQLCSNRLEYKYRGILHEFLDGPPGSSVGKARGLHIISTRDGARSQDPGKYLKDAELLKQALSGEEDPFLRSRYTFYLARSYDHAGEKIPALDAYFKRAELGYWADEVFISLLSAGHIKHALGHPLQEVIDTFLRASNSAPGRAEALHAASRLCRENKRFAEGYDYARRGLAIALPENGLFVAAWIYDYGLLDELAVNAYWTEQYQDCLDACQRLLREGKVPEHMRARVKKNADFAAEKLKTRADVKQPLPRNEVKPSQVKNLGSFGLEDFFAQHPLRAERVLYSRLTDFPRVLIAILAKQKEESLPLYLDCIESLDYPKSSIVLHVRTNNNTDGTERIIREWLARVNHLYSSVEFDATDVDANIEQFQVHEWNPTRFRVLGHIRNTSLRRAIDLGCDYYFVSDVDNFIRRCTLRELVALNLPIVAPLLRSIRPGSFYSNYHADIDARGYFQACDQYHWILDRHVRGILEMPVVHCTYLVRADVAKKLTYLDETDRYEYVIFSHGARKAGIPQYLDNRQVYGYITFANEDGQYCKQNFVPDAIATARHLLQSQ